MDYKLNILKKTVECEEILLQDIPTLNFGEADDDVVVFDASAFCRSMEADSFDWRTFSRINKKYIEGIARITGLDTRKLFYQDKGGHILIAQELVFLFLAFVDDTLLLYFNNLLADAMSNGVAFTDGFVVQIAAQRLPTEVLKQIINERNGEKQQSS